MRELKGKKEDIKGKFTNDELLEFVQRLYVHEGEALMVEDIETPHSTCINVKEVNKVSKMMVNGKVLM